MKSLIIFCLSYARYEGRVGKVANHPGPSPGCGRESCHQRVVGHFITMVRTFCWTWAHAITADDPIDPRDSQQLGSGRES
ncbi:hypothetical protein BRAS3843_1740010 [Bradyrhizobium sp. STM 3843]|nr:hypothetical protein BRAS3843_1740010 [Bradyrhizobium sp. STM 3843]